MKFNEPKRETQKKLNYEGGQAYKPASPQLGLYKVVINNLLQDKFYTDEFESFNKVWDRFLVCAEEDPEFVLKLAHYAREEMYLREAPQVLLVFAANHEDTKQYVREYAPKIIQRADELKETTAVQLELFGKPIPKPLKNGIADAFHSFDRYQFAKYLDRDYRKEVQFHDVMNLVHPKPIGDEEEDIFASIIKGELDDYPDVEPLEQPDTWEAKITENTKEEWLEVLPKMGHFARIRNLRNLLSLGIDPEKILDEKGLKIAEKSKVYPFRYYQAYDAIKTSASVEDKPLVYTEDWLSKAINKTAEGIPDYLEDTFVAVDLSGSMETGLSENSTMEYIDISSFFGAVLMGKGADTGVFASDFDMVKAHHDTPTLELFDKIRNKEVGFNTDGWKAIKYLVEHEKKYAEGLSKAYDRIVILTDMQIWDYEFMTGGLLSDDSDEETVKKWFDKYRENVNPDARLYMVDLSSYGDLVTPEGYPNVYNISGWNDKILDFIYYAEHPNDVIKDVENV